MRVSDIISLIFAFFNLIALIVIPILAVKIGQYLQTKAKKREEKLQVFKLLMTTRIYGWTVESVQALNIIDIVYADDDKVRTAWKELYDKLCVKNPDEVETKKIETAKYKLLEIMANSLGYKEQVTWETIQNPYLPEGMNQQLKMQAQNQNNLNALLTLMLQNATTYHSSNEDLTTTKGTKGENNAERND